MDALAKTVQVAPRAGAWIETNSCAYSATYGPVAPRAGAWIETYRVLLAVRADKSPPARGRGLKQQLPRTVGQAWSRPPRGGVD